MSRTLLSKTYSAEELSDLGRDVHEAFDERFTPAAKGIPKDEHGFDLGAFKVTIEWLAPDAEEDVPKDCPVCDGWGSVRTGIDEAPSTLCKACDGNGSLPK